MSKFIIKNTVFKELRYTNFSYDFKDYWIKISVNDRNTIYKLDFFTENENIVLDPIYLDKQEYENFQKERIGPN